MLLEFNMPLNQEWLINLIGDTINYWQFLQVQLLPQFQLLQLQFGLSHFCLSVGVSVRTFNVDFMITV